MSKDHDDLSRRMLVGKMMRDSWEADPPDPKEWIDALRGCADLYEIAAKHLEGENYAEAARCVAVAVKLGADVHPQIALAYAMSGQAVDDFMNNMRESLARYGQDGWE